MVHELLTQYIHRSGFMACTADVHTTTQERIMTSSSIDVIMHYSRLQYATLVPLMCQNRHHTSHLPCPILLLLRTKPEVQRISVAFESPCCVRFRTESHNACTMHTHEAGGCQQNQLENRCTRNSVWKHTQHGDSNATEIRCRSVWGLRSNLLGLALSQLPCRLAPVP